MINFFSIFDPISGQPEPIQLADLELVLRHQPEGQSLALWRYEIPSDFFPRPEVSDAVIADDLTLAVSAWGEEVVVGAPAENLSVVYQDGRIWITGADGTPAARCAHCDGLIRARDKECPHCTWQQWVSAEGFPARSPRGR